MASITIADDSKIHSRRAAERQARLHGPSTNTCKPKPCQHKWYLGNAMVPPKI
jgi:hypothetical protein